MPKLISHTEIEYDYVLRFRGDYPVAPGGVIANGVKDDYGSSYFFREGTHTIAATEQSHVGTSVYVKVIPVIR